jgi:arabinosaccharide transport system permease protein
MINYYLLKPRLTMSLKILFFVFISGVILFPIYCLIIASFKPQTEMYRYGLSLGIQLEMLTTDNYAFLFSKLGRIYLIWYKNSLIVTSIQTVSALLLTSMVGYGLALYHFKGRNLIFILVLFSFMVPIEILMLPLYRIMIFLHLINTYSGIILPYAVMPFSVFFFRQYASTLPKDFMDAARIDGANEYSIYLRIMMPLMKPAYGAMAILLALQSWNDFAWPLVVMRDSDMFTLPVGLMSLVSPYSSNYNMLTSGAVLAVIPVIILFFSNQKYFISGATAGAIKG